MRPYLCADEEISALCLELALLLHAGVDPAGGLSLAAEQTADARAKQLLSSMASAMDRGDPLSRAVLDSGAFPANVAAMLRVGETTGRLEQALRALSEYHNKRSQAMSRLRSALLYPSILLAILLAVIVVLLTKVLPIFAEVYANLGGQLTGLAGGLLQFGLVLNGILPGLCIFAAILACCLAAFGLSARLRGAVIGLWQKKFAHRALGGAQAQARFAQGLSMALSSGLHPEEALQTAADLLGGEVFAARAEQAAQQMNEGQSLARALGEAELLPTAQCRLLELGFAGGSGEEAMTEIARRLDEQAAAALERTLGRVEPAMVVTCSLLVGAVLLSVMLPLTRIMAAIG